jgi:hypothetical protein
MAISTLDTFKSNFAEWQRPTHFEVEISNINIPGAKFDSDFKIVCKASNVPAATTGVVEVPYLGRKIKVAGDRTFADWTVTVMDDVNHKYREKFERWMEYIGNSAFNVNASTPLYKATASIKMLERSAGAVTGEWLMVGLFPSEIGTIDMSYETNDAIAEYTVTFAYDYHTSGVANTAGGALANAFLG